MFTTVWSILLPFVEVNGHLVFFVAILVYFSGFGIIYQEKSGNPVPDLDLAFVSGRFAISRLISKI
jgi:hypothetical protein